MEQTAMKEGSQDQPPPTPQTAMNGKIFAETEEFNATHAAEQAETPTRMKRADHADAEHENVDNEDGRGNWGVATEEFGEPLAPRGKREAQAGAAFVAAVSLNADESAARGASCGRFSPEPPNMPLKICFQRAKRICQ